MNEIMEGEASAVQMSSYLTALSMKGRDRRGNHRFRGWHARPLCPPAFMTWMFWRL